MARMLEPLETRMVVEVQKVDTQVYDLGQRMESRLDEMEEKVAKVDLSTLTLKQTEDK